MIKLSDIILEYQKRSKPIDTELFKRILVAGHFNSAIKNYKNDINIFRGVENYNDSSQGFWIVNPQNTNRTSRNTNNFYTGLIDKLPSWKGWPKRSRSIVCATEYTNANKYGLLYYVLPKNGAKIGICSKPDFWHSFPLVQKRLKIDSMADFNSIFQFYVFQIKSEPLAKMAENLNEYSYDAFFEWLNLKISKEESICRRRGHLSIDTVDAINDDFERYLVDGQWEKYFDDLLNPEANGFKLQTIETFDTSDIDNREVWTDSTSLMVHEEKMQTFNSII